MDEGAAVVDARWRRFFCAVGDERRQFLHGQTSGHVLGLGPGGGCAALALTAQGRPLAMLALYEDGERIWIATTAACAGAARAALERFLVADDCEFEDDVDAECFSVVGPRAGEVLAAAGLEAPPEPWSMAAAADRSAIVFARGDLRVPCFDVLAIDGTGGRRNAAELFARVVRAGATEAGSTAYETLCVESGTARYGVDVDERRIAMEARLEWAVHFDKGCYVGQEVIERAVSRGRLNHELALLATETVADVGARVEGGGETDVVTSAVVSPRLGPIALAYVPVGSAAAGTRVELRAGDAVVGGEVLPWPRRRVLQGRTS